MESERTSIADYMLIEPINAGGQGTTWKASTPSRLGFEDDFVTLVTLPPGTSSNDPSKLIEALRSMNAAKSDHLVTVYEAGRHEGTIFYSFPFPTSGTLQQAPNDLSLSERMRAVAEVARGVESLHEVGVVHRDIRPSTMFRYHDRTRLGPIGLAQILEQGDPVSGFGSFAQLGYLAPELVMGLEPGRQSDVFALGSSLHYILTGSSAFPQLESIQSLPDAIQFMRDPAPKLSTELTDAQRQLIEACLAPNPQGRPLKALNLALDLDSFTKESS